MTKGAIWLFLEIQKVNLPSSLICPRTISQSQSLAFISTKKIWERIILPYVSTSIPPATKETKGKISIRVRYANGDEYWEKAPKG